MQNVIKSYTPSGQICADFLNDNTFVRCIMGPIGSGKTVACIADILNCAYSQEKGKDGKRHTRFAIIRNTYAELHTTTIKTWHEWVSKDEGKWRAKPVPSHHIVNDEIDMEVFFIALELPKSVKKLLSLELTMAYINEAKEVSEEITTATIGRIGRYPSAVMRPDNIDKSEWPTFSGLIMDTNMPDDDHYLYYLAEEETPKTWRFFKQPGGTSPAAENIQNLETGYYERLLETNRHKPDWINVYVHAKYGTVEDGKPVYPEYNDQTHCRDCEYDPKLPLIIGIDFGLTPAAAFLQRDILGKWTLIDELVSENMGAVRFGEELAAKIKRDFPNATVQAYGDPAGDQRAQTDERTPIQMIKNAGIPCKPAPTNDTLLRREAVAEKLNRLIDGVPGLIISKKCKKLRKGFNGGYKYKRIQISGDKRYQDKPDKNMFSHVHDALQYGMIGEGEGKLLIKPKKNAMMDSFIIKSHYNDGF